MPPVGLAADRPSPDAFVEIGAGALRRRDEPAEVLARVEEPAQRDGEPAVVRVRPDLLVEPLAGHERGLDTERGEGLGGRDEVVRMRWRIGEVEVAALAELAVDRLVGDERA